MRLVLRQPEGPAGGRVGRRLLACRLGVGEFGTDGFGLSESREDLRRHFEIDPAHIAVAALHCLAAEDIIGADVVKQAIDKFSIDPDKIDPVTL